MKERIEKLQGILDVVKELESDDYVALLYLVEGLHDTVSEELLLRTDKWHEDNYINDSHSSVSLYSDEFRDLVDGYYNSEEEFEDEDED